MDARWKRFPPVRGGLLVPLGSAPAAAAALSAHAACRPGAALAHRAAAAWTRLLGPAALPGPAVEWHPPLARDEWLRLLEVLRRETVVFDAMAVLERRQPGRAGMALLLLREGRPSAFVKMRPLPAAGLGREADALERVARAAPSAFAAPVALDWGSAGGWGWLALSAVPGPHHVPRSPRLDEVTAGVRSALAAIARPGGTPAHWEPMHGDLTPWNLRERPGHGLVLYDWERAGWGPPGADEVLYRGAALALRPGLRRDDPSLRERWPEAARWWAARLRERRPADAGERRLLRAQLRVLDPDGGADPEPTGLITGACFGGAPEDDGEIVVPTSVGAGR